MITTIKVDPDKKFDKKIKDAFAIVEDLTIPLELIKESWFKSNRAIFALAGPGKYADLTARYKRQKQKQVGFIYPILQRQGVLKSALTEPGNVNSIARIMNRRSLQVGVNESVAYFGFIHHGTKKMRARPYVLLGAEQVAPSGLNNRVEAWRKLLTDYVIGKVGGLSA